MSRNEINNGRKGEWFIVNWEEFLDPYIQTVGELKIKFRGVRKQYRKANRHSPIEFVTGRVKPIESIQEKMAIRHIKLENLAQDMQDIAGIRIMVQFVDDVEEVLDIIRKRKDMRVVHERDYINNMKASGYRSYHVVVQYPVDTINGNQTVLAEIQIRTLSMNFWATSSIPSTISTGGIFRKKSSNAWRLQPKLPIS